MPRDRHAHIQEAIVLISRAEYVGKLSDVQKTALSNCLMEAMRTYIKEDDETATLGCFIQDHKHEPDHESAAIVKEEGSVFLDVRCKVCGEWGSRKLTDTALGDLEW
jgi:hypothetical protein